MLMNWVAVQVLFSFIVVAEVPDDAARSDHFEKNIRPVLATHCFQCHGASKQKGGLRLDQRKRALVGGDTGKAIVPGHLDQGELIKAIRYEPDGFRMPPAGKLPQQTVLEFEKWIRDGAYWPAEKLE